MDLANMKPADLRELWAGDRLPNTNNEPRLGLATTAELIDEIRARCEVNGTLEYKTVGE